MAVSKSPNKIYGAFNIMDDNISSKAKINHSTLITSEVSKTFNTYGYSGDIELIAADIEQLTENDFEGDDKNGYRLKNRATRQKQRYDEGRSFSRGVRSLFSKFHAVPLENEAYGVRITQNMPLIDSPSTRRLQRSSNACTVKDLVEKSQQGLMGACVYDYSDFMFCKYLGRVPNNYMITLRRFAIPVNDYIKPYGNANAILPDIKSGSTKTDGGGISLGCMVTWLDTPGNEMSEIMKYNFSMPFKSVDAKWNDVDNTSGRQPKDPNSKGKIGDLYTKAMGNNVVRNLAARGLLGRGIYNPHGGDQISMPGPHYDSNKAYTGVDQIKSIYIRDPDKGLKFDQKFKLTFDYELRSYNGVNGKQAMLDLLGNILTVCYTTGDFWPGAYRPNGGSSSIQPLSSLECMKKHNTLSEYIQAFQKDKNTISAGFQNFLKNPIKTIMNLLDNAFGTLLGGEDQKIPPVMAQGRDALLSDNAVGLWHVTVGNPCAPMMSIGNLVMEDCSVEHYGPLGLDDFPTGLRVTCSFTCGKPRDKRLIERIYNGGNDRIYMPLDQQVLQMLRSSYKINNKGADLSIKSNAAAAKARTKKTGSNPDSEKSIAERNRNQDTAFRNAFADSSVYTVNSQTKPTSPKPVASISESINTADLVKRAFGDIGPTTVYGVVISAGETSEGAPTTYTQDSDMETLISTPVENNA